MKILLKDIHANPYRDFDRNPLIPERTQQLIDSINATEFWDNIVVRPAVYGKGYELAYGHHRLEAAKLAKPNGKKITHVDIPVKDLSDAVMVKMMADENLMQWGRSPAATLEAVQAARDLIEYGIENAETIEEFAGYTGIPSNATPASWAKLKNSGEAGCKLIGQVLGQSWSPTVINESLKVINADRNAEKLALEEAAAKKEAIALEKARKEAEAKSKAEAALAAEKAKIEAEKRRQAAEAEAKARSEKEAAAKKRAEAQAAKAKEALRKAKEASAKAEQARKAAADAERKATVEAEKKRKEAVAAHAAKQKLDGRVDRNTFEQFRTHKQASYFNQAVQNLNMTKAELSRCAKYVINKDISYRSMSTAVQNWFKTQTVAGKKLAENAKKQKALLNGTSLDDVIRELNVDMLPIIQMLTQVEPFIDSIEDENVGKVFFKRNAELFTIVNKLNDRIKALSAL